MKTYGSLTLDELGELTLDELGELALGRPPLQGPFHFNVLDVEGQDGHVRLDSDWCIRLVEVHS